MLRAMSRKELTGLEDEYAPILPGPGASDYERYLHTDELLSLQKPAEEQAHRDELLFQVTHQSSELWLKLAWNEVEAAIALLGTREIPPALRLLRRAALCLKFVTEQLDMLEQMSPWEYTSAIRPVLGHGSGFDSPGWSNLRRLAPELGRVFDELRREAGLTLIDLYRRGREFEELYQLAEALAELDERATMWRVRHFKVVERIIGGEVVGTQGTPVELLGGLIHKQLFPDLWKVRNALTELAKTEE
jgi:tryptophan 2,3-dioxygenase